MLAMRDVADEAGVSISTVSRALSGHPHVSEELRTRIHETARRLGYRPNGVARALREQRSRTVGIVLPDILNVTYATGAAVLQRVFQRAGYSVALLISDNDPAQELDCLERLREQRVDGVVHVPCTPGGAQLLNREGSEIPVVELFRHSSRRSFDSVLADDEAGAHSIAAHLADLGHRRIGIITGSASHSTTAHRQEGVLRALAARSIDPDECTILYGEYTRDWGRSAFSQLMREPAPPTAVFATSTELVLGVLLAAVAQGVRFPEDVSLAALGNPEWYQVVRTPITTYSLPLEDMAAAAAQLLVSRITQAGRPPAGPTSFVVSGSFFARASTTPPPHPPRGRSGLAGRRTETALDDHQGEHQQREDRAE